MKCILVIGGVGFIGFVVVWYIIYEMVDVVVVVDKFIYVGNLMFLVLVM